MTNAEIADNLSLLAKLMDIHGENSFKTKTYSNAAFQLEKVEEDLAAMAPQKIAALRGIGASVAQKISEMLTDGRFALLADYIAKTPEGVLDMMKIKGIGPKKINIIWKEMEIETLGELLYACNENRLTMYKGFGEKTQENIRNAINFFLSQQGLFLYQQTEQYVEMITPLLIDFFSRQHVKITGAFLRQEDIIETIEFLIQADTETIETVLADLPFLTLQDISETVASYSIENGPTLVLYACNENDFGKQLFLSSGTNEFNDAFIKQFGTKVLEGTTTTDDAYIFTNAHIPYILPCLRHDASCINLAIENKIPTLIDTSDIKGIIHSHSKWSDGAATLAEMSAAAKSQGFEYLVISDHSRSAGYANGLSAERIAQQHQEINALNQTLSPFKIFKSIESDILIDGSLDYPDDILETFDLVIASVHSVLKMPEEKAMSRLIKAIENPFTSILGHMTGRLLLSRPGYPINHKRIIQACVANKVAIELNAHPRRLDMDWSWIPYAIEQGAIISINPDAHAVEGYGDIKYGVLAAQKGRLTASKNLSSYTLFNFEQFIAEQKSKR